MYEQEKIFKKIQNLKNKYYGDNGEITFECIEHECFVTLWDDREKINFWIKENEIDEFLVLLEKLFKYFDFSFLVEGYLKDLKQFVNTLRSE